MTTMITTMITRITIMIRIIIIKTLSPPAWLLSPPDQLEPYLSPLVTLMSAKAEKESLSYNPSSNVLLMSVKVGQRVILSFSLEVKIQSDNSKF